MQRASIAIAFHHESIMTLSARQAVDEMNLVLDAGPPMVDCVFSEEVKVTGRWHHGAIHASTVPMEQHVVMTYYGTSRSIRWKDGCRSIQSMTCPGTITLIPRGHEARWDLSGSIEVSHVYITDDRLQACADQYGARRPTHLIDRVGWNDGVASRLLEVLAQAGERGHGLPKLFFEQTLDLVCARLISAHTSAEPDAPMQRRGGLADWQVRRVTDFLNEHLNRDVGLDELASLVGLSRYHFCTAFRRATGKPPHQWFAALRMTRARYLLRQGALPITEIALEVGFQTPSSFAAAFRKVEGRTPSQFRSEG